MFTLIEAALCLAVGATTSWVLRDSFGYETDLKPLDSALAFAFLIVISDVYNTIDDIYRQLKKD